MPVIFRKKPTDISDIVLRYQAGESLNRLADATGFSDGTLKRWLVSEGVKVKQINRPPEDLAIIIQQYSEGTPIQRLAKDRGLSPMTLARWIRKSGVKMRTKAEAGRKTVLERCVINIPNLAEIAERHLGGEQIGTLAKELGINPNTLRGKLVQRGVKIRHPRFRSEVDTAELVRLYRDQFWPIVRISQQTGLCMKSIRNRLTKAGVVIREQAKNREHNLTFATPSERILDAELNQFGVRTTPQKAAGDFNIDLAIEDFRIAVEVESGYNFAPRARPKLLRRTKHLLDDGWCVLFISTAGNRLVFPNLTERLFVLMEMLSGGEPLHGQYDVVGRYGQDLQSEKYNLKGLPRFKWKQLQAQGAQVSG